MSIEELTKPKAKGRPSNRPDNTWLLTLYQNTTATELAKQFKVGRSTIYAWIKEAREELTEKA